MVRGRFYRFYRLFVDVFSSWTFLPWTFFPSGHYYRGHFFLVDVITVDVFTIRGHFFRGRFFRGRYFRGRYYRTPGRTVSYSTSLAVFWRRTPCSGHTGRAAPVSRKNAP